MYKNNREYKNDIALNYFDHKITYGELFQNIEKTAKSFYALVVREGESVVVCSINIPETIYTIYALNRLGVVVNMIDPRSANEAVKEYRFIERLPRTLIGKIDYRKLEEMAKR